jgi:hypothetical protein
MTLNETQKTFMAALGTFRAKLQAIKAHCDYNYSDRPDNSSQHVGEIIKEFDDLMGKYSVQTVADSVEKKDKE